MTRLQQRWLAVLADYFPRWRAGRAWRCISRTRRTGRGYCDAARRAVEVCEAPADDDALDLLLIHEIAHATASPGHGVVWQRRLALAAAKARGLGRPALADLLASETADYRENAEPPGAAYAAVEDALREHPDLTLAQVKRGIARRYGRLARDVDQAFPRLGAVYRKARKEARGWRPGTRS